MDQLRAIGQVVGHRRPAGQQLPNQRKGQRMPFGQAVNFLMPARRHPQFRQQAVGVCARQSAELVHARQARPTGVELPVELRPVAHGQDRAKSVGQAGQYRFPELVLHGRKRLEAIEQQDRPAPGRDVDGLN